MQFNYEQLHVTKTIHNLIREIYSLSGLFPTDEKYGLTSQLRRAAILILLNLAEGSARSSKAEFARFLKISIGSLVETDACIKVAVSLGYLDKTQLVTLNPLLQEVFYKLVALRKSQTSNKSGEAGRSNNSNIL